MAPAETGQPLRPADASKNPPRRAVVSTVTLTISGKTTRIAAADAAETARTDLAHILDGVLCLCKVRHQTAQAHVVAGLNVAGDILNRKGRVLVTGEPVQWTAVNQFDRQSSEVMLKQMAIDNRESGRVVPIGRSDDLVDRVKEVFGGTCTIFQRMNDRGDMLRISTNVLKKDGSRATGTYIPAVNPDGRTGR